MGNLGLLSPEVSSLLEAQRLDDLFLLRLVNQLAGDSKFRKILNLYTNAGKPEGEDKSEKEKLVQMDQIIKNLSEKGHETIEMDTKKLG